MSKQFTVHRGRHDQLYHGNVVGNDGEHFGLSAVDISIKNHIRIFYTCFYTILKYKFSAFSLNCCVFSLI